MILSVYGLYAILSIMRPHIYVDFKAEWYGIYCFFANIIPNIYAFALKVLQFPTTIYETLQPSDNMHHDWFLMEAKNLMPPKKSFRVIIKNSSEKLFQVRLNLFRY